MFPHHANSLIHVAVTEDEEGGLPPELQRNFLQITDCTAVRERESKVLCSCGVRPVRVSRVLPLHDLFADRRRAGEAQLADVWVLGQTLSNHATWRRSRRSRDRAQGNDTIFHMCCSQLDTSTRAVSSFAYSHF